MGKVDLLSINYAPVILEAVVLSGISSALAQAVEVLGQQDLSSFRLLDIAQFIIFAALTTAPNYAFQHTMEVVWPSRTSIKSQRAEPEKDQQDINRSVDDGRISIRNTLIKFVLDQSISASVNTLLFIGLLGFIKGHSLEYIYSDITNVGISLILQSPNIADSFGQNFWTMLLVSYRFWPAVCLINLVMVPLAYRPLVGNLAGLGWNVFLNLRQA